MLSVKEDLCPIVWAKQEEEAAATVPLTWPIKDEREKEGGKEPGYGIGGRVSLCS